MKVLKENALILKLKFNAIKLKFDQAHVEQPEIFHHHDDASYQKSNYIFPSSPHSFPHAIFHF